MCKTNKPLSDYYKGKNMCKKCVSQYSKNWRKGIKLRAPKKLTSYAGYDWLEVDINKYEDYFEPGFKERTVNWIIEEIIPELNHKKSRN